MTSMTSERRAGRAKTLWLVALALTGVALFCVLVPLQTVFAGTPLPLAILLGAAVCGAPVVAVTHPRIAVAGFTVAALVLPLTVSGAHDPAWPWPWSVTALIAFALLVLVVTAVHGWRLGLLLWGAANAGSLVVLLVRPDAASPATTADLIVTASISAAVLLVGVLLAGRIRLGEELTRSRELTALEQSRRALMEERTRIARELHDVVAHGMSVIQVQASTARYRVPDLPDAAAAEFDDIAAAARRSLGEMRRLLGLLRTEDHEQELAPQQGVEDIPALVEDIRRAGAEVDLTITRSVAPDAMPASAGITAYRIVQEALSNAVRHAPGAAIRVEVTDRPAGLEIRVHDRGGGVPEGAGGGGHGLRGMRERVGLLAGTLTAGPDPAGGWTVAALLPWTTTEETT